MALTTINSGGVKDDSIVNADIKSDAAIALSKLASTPAVLTGSTNNTIVTVTGANAITGEASLTYNGTDTLSIDHSATDENSYIKIAADDNRRKTLVFDSGGTTRGVIGIGDSDEASATSLFLSASSNVAGNSPHLVIDSGGNVGIGVTPDTWSTGNSLTVGTSQGTIWGAGDQLDISGNAYFNSGWKAAATKAGASLIEQALGNIDFKVSGSVTADAAITWIDALRIDSSGRLQIGSSTSTVYNDFDGVGRLSLNNNSADGTVDFTQGIVFTSNASNEGTWTHAGIVATGSTGYDGNLIFGTDGANGRDQASITEKMRITSDGDVGIGTNSPSDLLTVSGSSGVPQITVENTSNSARESAINIKGKHSNGTVRQLMLKYDSNDTFRIHTAGSMHITVETNDTIHTRFHGGNANGRHLEILSGDLQVASGHGIDFSARQNNQTTGATTGSELLEHYEEGTWTPTFVGSTGNPTLSGQIATGIYTKVGNLVTVTYYSGSFTLSGSPGGTPYIGGLPFTAKSTGNNYATAYFTHTSCFNADACGYVNNGGNSITVLQTGDTTAGNTWESSGTKYLMVHFTYLAA